MKTVLDCNTLPDPVNSETQLGNKAVELVSVRLKILYRSFLAVAWSRKAQLRLKKSENVLKFIRIFCNVLTVFVRDRKLNLNHDAR